MPIDRTDKERVAYLHSEYHSIVKRNETLSLAAKWMELEDVVWSEIS